MPLFFFFLALAGPFPEGGRFPALLFLFTLPPEEALIAGCLRALEGGACTVWTGADNRPALGAYQSMGFQADGWRSAVLIRP